MDAKQILNHMKSKKNIALEDNDADESTEGTLDDNNSEDQHGQAEDVSVTIGEDKDDGSTEPEVDDPKQKKKDNFVPQPRKALIKPKRNIDVAPKKSKTKKKGFKKNLNMKKVKTKRMIKRKKILLIIDITMLQPLNQTKVHH